MSGSSVRVDVGQWPSSMIHYHNGVRPREMNFAKWPKVDIAWSNAFFWHRQVVDRFPIKNLISCRTFQEALTRRRGLVIKGICLRGQIPSWGQGRTETCIRIHKLVPALAKQFVMLAETRKL